MTRVIDVHIHLSESHEDALNGFARKNDLSYTLDELLRTMRRLRIEKGLLLSPPLRGGSIFPNQSIIELCKRSGEVLSPVITVEPTAKEVKAALKLAKENKQVKGFKIRLGYVKAASQDRVFGPLYDYAESKKLPVLFHTGDTAFSNGNLSRSHPLSLDGLANEREELRIVLCHFGNPWFEDAAELIYKHPNVYGDISGLITGGSYAREYSRWLARRISEAVYYAANADKVLFGTDYPVSKHSAVLDLVRSLKVDKRDKEKILWRNAERLFGL